MYSAASSSSSSVALGPRFEQRRLALLTHGLKEAVILHVPSADLQHVGIAGDEFHVLGANHLGDDRQSGFIAGGGQDFQPVFLQPLEAVGAGARFERPAAQCRGSRGLHGPGGRQRLLFALHRARAGDDAELPIADREAAGADHGRLGLHLAAGDFVGGEDGHDFRHARHAFQRLAELIPLFADGRDDGPFGAVDRVGFQAELLDPLNRVFDLFGRRAAFHDNDHCGAPLDWSSPGL